MECHHNYIVYVAISPSGKMYVGMTGKTLHQRISGHIHMAKNPKTYFYHALHKYGNQFNWFIAAENLTKLEAYSTEKLLIKNLNTMDNNIGYNSMAGGTGGTMPDEIIQKSKIKIMAQLTPERRKAIGERVKRDNNTPDINAKLRRSQKMRWSNPKARDEQSLRVKNHFSNIENRRKMAVSGGGGPIICNENNKLYYTLKEAATNLNICYKAISPILTGRRKSHKGYTFRRATSEEIQQYQ